MGTITNKKYIFYIGGLPYGFINHQDSVPSGMQITTWHRWLRIYFSSLSVKQKIDPLENEPSISDIQIELLNKEGLFASFLKKHNKFVTILTSDIGYYAEVNDTFTVQDWTNLASSGYIWIGHECLGYEKTATTNTLRITSRNYYYSVKQRHIASTENENTYIYNSCPGIRGRTAWLKDTENNLIYKGIVEDITPEKGVLILSITPFMNVLKTPFINLKKYKPAGVASVPGALTKENEGIPVTIQNLEGSTVVSQMVWIESKYANIYEILRDLQYFFSELTMADQYFTFTFTMQNNRVRIEVIWKGEQQYSNPWHIKAHAGLLSYMGFGDTDDIELPMVDRVLMSGSYYYVFAITADNPPQEWCFIPWGGNSVDYVEIDMYFYDDGLPSLGEHILFDNGESIYTCYVAAVTDNLVTLRKSNTLLGEEAITRDSYWCDGAICTQCVELTGTLYDIVSDIDNLASGEHPEVYTSADFDLTSFANLDYSELSFVYTMLTEDTNLLDIIKHDLKLLNAVLCQDDDGLFQVKQISKRPASIVPIVYDNIPKLTSRQPLTEITIKYNYMPYEDKFLSELPIKLNDKLINSHINPRSETIESRGLDISLVSADETIRRLTKIAIKRFLLFGTDSYEIEFKASSVLQLGETYLLNTQFVPEWLRRVLIIERTYDVTSGYNYKGIAWIDEGVGYWAPCALCTSYDSETGWCDFSDYNLFSESPATDLDFFDPQYWEQLSIDVIAVNNTESYSQEVLAANPTLHKLMLNHAMPAPTAPFLVVFGIYNTREIGMENYVYVCDKDDRYILDTDTGYNWEF